MTPPERKKLSMHPKITPEHLKRRAVIYIRQSSPGQLIYNLESQRRQYALADQARQLGFQQVEVIDQDLGRTESGQVARPGFERLVAEVCSGQVAAVFCLEASRLARNGRDWHHLIELCGLVHAVLIDFDGVYDPCVLNARLLLGLTRPDTQSTSYSISFEVDESRVFFRLRSTARLALGQSVPPTNIPDVLTRIAPTKC